MFQINAEEKMKKKKKHFFKYFPHQNRAVYGMWKNTVQPDRTQMTLQYDACALHAG